LWFLFCVAAVPYRPDGWRREKVGDDKESNSGGLLVSGGLLDARRHGGRGCI